MKMVWVVVVGLVCVAVRAQEPCKETMPGMQMCTQDSGMARMMANMKPRSFVQAIERHGSSGTSAEPNSTPVPMVTAMRGEWMLMVHGNAFVTDTQQSGPRGGDKFFSTNWVMPMAIRQVGPGQLTLRAMFSLEPATVTGREYPLLFQQGETAFGKAIVDGQHPHDFFMEIAALYDWRVGAGTLLSFYAAPMGDPALGPTAYPHRWSASENPVGSLGHHQEDSTHIADNVVTMGVAKGIMRVEASGFHGREPDENRWNIDGGAIDSWSTRLTVQPGQNWSGQVSFGAIKSPEALAPKEDQRRVTASAMYNRPFRNGNWASTVVWGRTKTAGAKENSYLAESTVRFATANYAWTRLENAGRTSELLGAGDEPLAHVAAYTFGYARDVMSRGHVRVAVGAQMSAYGVPEVLRAAYGARPLGGNVFVRLRLFDGEQR